MLNFGALFSHSRAKLTKMDKCCLLSSSSWSQSDLFLARGPWDQHSEVHLYEQSQLLRSSSLHLRGSFTRRCSSREAQVQQPSSHLHAAAAAGTRPSAVCHRDVQKLWLHREDHWWRPKAEHRGAFQQVPYYTYCICFCTAALLSYVLNSLSNKLYSVAWYILEGNPRRFSTRTKKPQTNWTWSRNLSWWEHQMVNSRKRRGKKSSFHKSVSNNIK